MTHTKDNLANELEKAGLHDMAVKARTGHYHDFLSPLDFPDLQLDADLVEAGTPQAEAIRKRHHNGEFDASIDESDEWINSNEGREAMQSMTRPKTDGS